MNLLIILLFECFANKSNLSPFFLIGNDSLLKIRLIFKVSSYLLTTLAGIQFVPTLKSTKSPIMKFLF